MRLQTEPIKFKNRQNAKAQFDLISLEELLQRKNIDHSIDAPHRVEFYILLFVEQGKGKHTIDFKDYKCNAGTLLTIRKDQIHHFFKDSDLKGSLLLFTDDFLVSYLEEMEAQKTMLLFNEQLAVPRIQLKGEKLSQITQIVNRIREEYLSTNDKHSLGIIRSELHILITRLFRLKAEQEKINVDKKYLKEFLRFQELIEHNATALTRVKDYAHLMQLSDKTLNTVTRAIIHKSAKEFIDEIRTKQIKRLLINTSLTIKEIAYESGFNDPTNFYKYFKRQTQITPEQFRATY